MPFFARMSPGTKVIAVADFGPIIRGQLGVVDSLSPWAWVPWERGVYVCTFLGGIKATAKTSKIVPYGHGADREMLEDPLWFLHLDGVPKKDCRFAAGLRHPAHWPG